MSRRTTLITAGRGAVAGLSGGLVSGFALGRPLSAVLGWALYLALAVPLGAGFALLVRQQRDGGAVGGGAGGGAGPAETVFWGMAFGMLGWYLGALTLLPVIERHPVSWSVPAARAAFPLLLGQLLYGVTTGAVLAGLNRPVLNRAVLNRPELNRAELNGPGLNRPGRIRLSGLARGLGAGLGATWGLAAALPGSGSILVAGQGLGVALGLGVSAGLGHAVLFGAAERSLGPAAVRGTGYGFLLWVLFPLTVQPLLRGSAPLWSAEQVQARFATLPAFVLFGALIAVLSTAVAWLGRLLLAGPAERADEEGLGARTLRAVGRGAGAGVIGGLLFTVIMVQIGYLSTVAGLVGSDVTGVGLAVHLAVSVILGASYGVLFRRQSGDPVSGAGWGIGYGFLWWVLGALTVLPLALGGGLQWSAAGAAAGFPSLVGHLVYGAGVGVVFHRLEARHDPWWIQPVTAAARRAAAIARRTERQRAAPGVWALVVPMAVTVLVVLGQLSG